MSSSSKSFANVASFIALAIAACLLLLGKVLGLFNITIDLNIFNLIREICVLIAIAIGGYEFSRGKSSLIKILYWVFVAVCVLSKFGIIF